MHIGPPARDPGLTASQIAARRQAAGDDGLEALGVDPFSAVRYVCTHRSVRAEVLAADALDALTIIRSLRVALDRDELSLIKLACANGITLGVVAQALGLRTRQAAEQRRLRLEEQAEQRRSRVPGESRSGGERSEVKARERARRTRREEAWLVRHTMEIKDVCQAMVSAPFSAAGTTETLEDLLGALDDPYPPAGTLMVYLRDLLAAAHSEGETQFLSPGLVGRADRLIGAWEPLRPPP